MRDVVGYEGLYAVTSCGKVWSYKNKEFLKRRVNNDGYLRVALSKNGKVKQFLVHRLLAEAYIPNPDNLPQVNHKDECKTNNCLQNLEWCNAKYNANYGTRNERYKKPILQFDLKGNFIREWPSATDVGKEVKSHICHCLNGDRKTAIGYIWKYKN